MSKRPEIIADTSTLSNFARSGWWWVLERLFPEGMFTPDDVMVEIEKGIEKGYELGAVVEAQGNWLEVIEVLSDTEVTILQRLKTKYRAIRQGAEGTVLAIAGVRQLACLMDDKAAIRAARELGIAVITTYDVLQRALRNGIISQKDLQKVTTDLSQKARFKIKEG